ncbi:NAD(P)/FAD-dependent oxidoreductase [Marinobacter caseinilyticus]|uniref:NAD(P)/FAD-dependent oxidoreductase n=1 Tax=Marinobacter caseinilyticus TaxID=2692195 RepID=UPI001409BFA4|nr:NAD(P)/FAD-dependent oxidoreductase [Marinobacter caseinilyticus]
MAEVEQLVTDTIVIGAGVIGLAVARLLAMRGQEVIVLEAGTRFGEGISSRNSEVIHAGIYYPEGSLKARLCVAGRQALYRYCETHKVACANTGKWIIASHPEQQSRLAAIQHQAHANGVQLSWGSAEAIAKALPEVHCESALYSPLTGIVDSHGLMLSLLGELESHGGQLVCQAPVVRVQSNGGSHRVAVGGASPCEIDARRVINAAGLNAVPIAKSWLGYPSECCPDLYYARGCYFSYSGRHPFSTLVYPVPEEGGLGVHLTLDLAGQARFGPDVEWIDHPDFTVDPGRRESFAKAISSWWPSLDPARLQPSYAGVRPKLQGAGEGFRDFEIQDESVHSVGGLIQLFGIESPGLTASLAIADTVADRLG